MYTGTITIQFKPYEGQSKSVSYPCDTYHISERSLIIIQYKQSEEYKHNREYESVIGVPFENIMYYSFTPEV